MHGVVGVDNVTSFVYKKLKVNMQYSGVNVCDDVKVSVLAFVENFWRLNRTCFDLLTLE